MDGWFGPAQSSANGTPLAAPKNEFTSSNNKITPVAAAPSGSSSNSASGWMAVSQLTNSLASIGSAVTNANAVSSQGKYQKQVADFNAKAADLQGQDALAQGEKQVSLEQKQVKQSVGATRASQAAQGTDVNSGSNAQIQRDTQYMGALDAITIRNNAARQAFGYKAQSNAYTVQGQFANLAAQNTASNTLLTGGLSALSGASQAVYYGSGGSYRRTDNSGVK